MFRSGKAVAGREALSKEAGAAVDAELRDGEEVRAVMEGTRGSALIVSETRGFIWKANTLSVYPFENLSGITFNDGLAFKWAQFRGPSVGQVPAALATVTELPDAIHLSKINKEARSSVEALVHAGARSIPNPDLDVRTSVKTRDSEMPGELGLVLEAEGSGGHLWLFEDRVRIKHFGLRGAISSGVFKGDKEIGIDQISAVQWRNPGSVTLGHIQFSFMGGSSDAWMASRDENAVLFSKVQESAFRRLKDELDVRMRTRRAGTPGATSVKEDVPDQIRKLADLRDAGILTAEEFETKKAELLTRM